MSPQALYSELAGALPDDAIIALEGNVSLAAGQRALKIRHPASWLDPGRNGIIGASIPFAMGAKLAFPERPSIALCSDTGFGMSAMNLEAAVRHHIPITVVIANNDGNFGALRQKKYFPSEYPERFSEFLPGLRYERVMEMFGGHAEYVSQRQEVRPALARALASGLPACLNVRLDPHAAHLGFW
jgi:acetolactate synthase-1/2/3 large subunit